MKKAQKFKMCMILGIILAGICFIGAAYLLITKYLATKDIDFTWTTNILLGLSGILIVFGNWCGKQSKEHTSLFD
ncbi:hypothetical protein ACFL6I_17030 [candidate division KSB1 bacterium]